MATSEMEIIKTRTGSLSEPEKRQLIEFLTKSLKNGGQGSQQIEFGKYRNSGSSMSEPEDLKIAEWHGSDLNGD